jgi:acetyl-CoA synthetase
MSEATSALHEDSRSFAPSPEFTAQANAGDLSIYDKAAADPEAFWAGYAEQLDWFQKWTKVLDWDAPHAKWFVDG